MDTCIETNENRAFGMEVYSRYIPGICKGLEYVRRIPHTCLTYDAIRIPDAAVVCRLPSTLVPCSSRCQHHPSHPSHHLPLSPQPVTSKAVFETTFPATEKWGARGPWRGPSQVVGWPRLQREREDMVAAAWQVVCGLLVRSAGLHAHCLPCLLPCHSDRACPHTRKHSHARADTRTRIHARTHTHTHTHMHAHAREHTHTHTHTHTPTHPPTHTPTHTTSFQLIPQRNKLGGPACFF